MFRPEEAILWPWLGGWVRGQCKEGNKNVITDSWFCGDTKKEMRWTESFVKSPFIDFCFFFFNSWMNTDTHTNNIKCFCFDIVSTNDHCVDDIKYLRKVKWSEVAQSCPTLCDPMDCSLPGSSVPGILQAKVLEWIAFPSPGDLPKPGIEPRSPTLQADALPSEPPETTEGSSACLLSYSLSPWKDF